MLLPGPCYLYVKAYYSKPQSHLLDENIGLYPHAFEVSRVTGGALHRSQRWVLNEKSLAIAAQATTPAAVPTSKLSKSGLKLLSQSSPIHDIILRFHDNYSDAGNGYSRIISGPG